MILGRQLDFLTRLIPTWRQEPLPSPKQPDIRTAPQRDADVEAKARKLLRALQCDDLAKRVCIRWNPRMRSTAGTALVAKALITLNPHLWDFGAAEVDRTLRHELAHLLAHHRAGRRRISPHGPEWQQACRDLGLLDEKRCHTLALPRRELTARHFYRCPACAEEVKRVRPFRRKTACLDCCRRHNRGRYDERFRFLKIPAARK
ncbi:MAG: SprT-like domain-containing protein [Chthoniobacter sp.]|uniref:SprT family zinc-dependent metalloprotease n=1 Tax=Chthoniobacter sp. TaxID=2510640 RepID=UPI0032A60E08